MVQALNEMKTGNDSAPLDVSLEFAAASREVGIELMVVLCQRVLDGLGVPAEWVLSTVVPIFKGNGDIKNCTCY